MNKIICCVNRTQVKASVLINQTLRLAQYFEAAIHFVKVVDPDAYVSSNEQSDALDDLRGMVDGHTGKEHASIPYDCSLLMDDLLPALGNVIRDEKADLLVLGTNDEGILYKYLIGDDTLDIAQKITCPALLIPPMESQFAVKRIIFSTALMGDEFDALRELRIWASVFRAKVLCLHICPSQAEFNQAEKRMQEMKALFSDDGFEYEIQVGGIVDSLADKVGITHADLIVALHRRKSWWVRLLQGSASALISKRIKVPMLLFKDMD